MTKNNQERPQPFKQMVASLKLVPAPKDDSLQRTENEKRFEGVPESKCPYEKNAWWLNLLDTYGWEKDHQNSTHYQLLSRFSGITRSFVTTHDSRLPKGYASKITKVFGFEWVDFEKKYNLAAKKCLYLERHLLKYPERSGQILTSLETLIKSSLKDEYFVRQYWELLNLLEAEPSQLALKLIKSPQIKPLATTSDPSLKKLYRGEAVPSDQELIISKEDFISKVELIQQPASTKLSLQNDSTLPPQNNPTISDPSTSILETTIATIKNSDNLDPMPSPEEKLRQEQEEKIFNYLVDHEINKIENLEDWNRLAFQISVSRKIKKTVVEDILAKNHFSKNWSEQSVQPLETSKIPENQLEEKHLPQKELVMEIDKKLTRQVFLLKAKDGKYLPNCYSKEDLANLVAQGLKATIEIFSLNNESLEEFVSRASS